MNQRIKELMSEAGTDSSGKWMSVDNSQHLAELIVRDCVAVIMAWKSEPFPLDPEFAAKQIKEHFGIKL